MKAKLPYVQSYRDRHGKLRSYYRRGKAPGQRIDGQPGSAGWLASYARIHESFEQPARQPAQEETLDYAIQDYLGTPRYLNLATNTRANYRSVLDELSRKFGAHALAEFTRGAIVDLRDGIARRSAARANLAVNVLRLVFERACDIDTIDRNPAKGVRPPDGFKSVPHRKWTDGEIELFKDEAKPHVRRAMMVLLHTGLRASDALSLKRDIVKGGMIELATGKTGIEVSIPVHEDLRAELARSLPIETMRLIAGARGQQLQRHGLLAMFRREFARLGVAREDQPTVHGLRKNAVVALVELGADVDMIHSVTGQSPQTIKHYAREYQRRKLAKKVVKLWEGGESV